MIVRHQYSKEEKQAILREFASSGLERWAFVKAHPEYKPSTLYQWLKLGFPENSSELDEHAVSAGGNDSISKFNCVVDTAKMSPEELGAFCRSNGIYAAELNTWKLNCMHANDEHTRNLEAEIARLRAENKQYKEENKAQLKELKAKDKDLDRMKSALAEYAVKEAFIKKANALFGINNEER